MPTGAIDCGSLRSGLKRARSPGGEGYAELLKRSWRIRPFDSATRLAGLLSLLGLFAVETLPGISELLPKLAHAALGELEGFRHVLRSFADRQGDSDPAVPLGMHRKPPRKIHAEGCLLGNRRLVIFDHGLAPLVALAIKVVDGADGEAFLPLGMTRQHILGVHYAADAATIAELGDRVADKGGRERPIDFALLDQAVVGDAGVGDDLGDGVFTFLRWEILEGVTGLGTNGGQHAKKSGVPGRARDLGGCCMTERDDHLDDLLIAKAARSGRPCG